MITEKDLLKLIQSSIKSKNKINVKSSSKNTPEWDSLAHLNILTILDKKLKGKTSKIRNLAEADSVVKILKVLKLEKLIK